MYTKRGGQYKTITYTFTETTWFVTLSSPMNNLLNVRIFNRLDLAQRVDAVKDENVKLKSENQVS